MHWIKHLTAFSRKSVMIEVGDELGNGACYAVWLLLERIGEPWDGTKSPELCLPTREWRKITQLSEQKFQKLLKILQANGVIVCAADGKRMTIHADILLELKDESTRKRRKASGMEPDSGRTFSGPDTDKEPEKEKEQNASSPFSAQEERSIARILRQRGIDPESPQGEGWFKYLEKQKPRSPMAYLTSVLRDNPYFNPTTTSEQTSAHPPPSRRDGCLQSSGEILSHMRFPIQGRGP